MSAFTINGLQDDEPFDDIPSGGQFANLSLQDYGSPAAAVRDGSMAHPAMPLAGCQRI